MIFWLGLSWAVQLVNLLEMNMMQFWHVQLPKWAAASSTRLSFCLALIHSLAAACEVFVPPVSASQLPNCLRASLTPKSKFKAGSARMCAECTICKHSARPESNQLQLLQKGNERQNFALQRGTWYGPSGTFPSSQVYVHCLVAICSPGSPCRGQCSPSKERKGKCSGGATPKHSWCLKAWCL